MPDLFTAQQLADYLQLSRRTIYRLVDRDQIPAIRVGGQWRFLKSAVDYWLDVRMNRLALPDLDALDADSSNTGVSLRAALVEANALIPVAAGPVESVVREFVARVRYPEPVDTAGVAERVLERQSLCSTAVPGGVAVLHTARWMSRVLRGHDLLAVGRLSEPMDFGALDGGTTDLLALMLARNERHHLVLLTKMTRLCQEEPFVEALRSARGPRDVMKALANAERSVFLSPAGGR